MHIIPTNDTAKEPPPSLQVNKHGFLNYLPDNSYNFYISTRKIKNMNWYMKVGLFLNFQAFMNYVHVT